jgi:TonB-dependent SusC/RagA subfamily outer membrane receptor
METYLIYIGKAAIAACAFYIAFLLLFQNQKHFTFNRIYLPVSLALSFVIPLITFTTVKYIEPVNFDANSFAYLAPVSGEIVQPAFVFEWYHYLFGLYLLGTAGFLFHLLLGHLKAINIIQKSRVQKIFNNLVNITQKDVHPFSFFSKIVVSEKTLSHPDLEMIVSHENIHVREKHTFDILFTEIIFLLQWFNPFAWLLKDAVKNNLEYLTDHEIAKLYNPQTYQLAMVTLADKQGIAPFLTALNGSQLKNRIVMMKKKTENKYAFVKQLVVLPLLAVLVMGLSNREVKTEVVQLEKNDKIISLQTELQKNEKTSFKDFKIVVDGKEISIDKPEFDNIKLTEENNYNGRITVEIVEALNINSDDIRLSKSSVNSENPFLYIRTKDYVEGSNPEFDNKMALPDIQSFLYTSKNELKREKTVKGMVSNGNGVPLVGVSVIIKGNTIGTITDTKGNYEIRSESEIETMIFAMTGYVKQEIKVGNKGEINVKLKTDVNAKPREIEVVGYQSKENKQPQNGGFAISGPFQAVTKQGSENAVFTPSTGNGLTIRATGGLTGQPLYVVNGIETSTTTLNELSPDSIESISVLKDKSATILYGDKGKNGVVMITTKKYGQNNKSGNVYGNSSALLGNPAPFGSATGKTDQPLILVNGKESGQTLNNIDPATIESVYVLKNEKATEKYGEKGKNGVLEIITKAKYTTCDGESSFYMSVENSKVLELRRKIAQSIKYPVLAQENNQQGVVEIWAFIAKDGTISNISEKRPDGKFINVDEVVVTSYKSEKNVTSEKSNDLALLVKESKRVIEQISPFNIPEFAGETVCFRIQFVLQ